MPEVVVLDACVLYPIPLRDTLLRVARQNLCGVRWSNRILDAVARNLSEDRRASPEQADRARTAGLVSLTPSELRVCRLAAEGLKNTEIAQALFVSLKTVETHLRSSYRKLDITSRGELPQAIGISQP